MVIVLVVVVIVAILLFVVVMLTLLLRLVYTIHNKTGKAQWVQWLFSGLENWEIVIWFSARANIFSVPREVRNDLSDRQEIPSSTIKKVKRPRYRMYYSLVSTTELNTWSYANISPVCLHGVNMDKSTTLYAVEVYHALRTKTLHKNNRTLRQLFKIRPRRGHEGPEGK
jgi:hypothetical protein